jgi:hypothetical protein
LICLTFGSDKLSWIVFATGTIISGYVSNGTPRTEQLLIDSKLIAMVFRITQVVDFRVSLITTTLVPLCLHLDQALLHFFQDFRKSHVGFDSANLGVKTEVENDPQIYGKISENLGQRVTQNDVLSMIIQKVVTVLETWAQNTEIADLALKLLGELSAGYTSSKLIANLDTAKALLKNHGVRYPFCLNRC